MDKFIPYRKLSKKKQREHDKKHRVTWGFSPVTRNAQNPKAYNRQKARKWDRDDFPAVPSVFLLAFLARRWYALRTSQQTKALRISEGSFHAKNPGFLRGSFLCIDGTILALPIWTFSGF